MSDLPIYSPDNELIWNKYGKILSKELLNIPHLHMIGYANHRIANNQLRTHYHKTIEITVMLNGTQEYYIDDTLYTVQSGDIFITYPYENHGNKGNYQNVGEYFWFQLDLTPSDEYFLGLMPPFGELLYQKFLQYTQRILKANKNDLSCLKDVFFAFASPNPQDHLPAYTKLLNFIINNFYNHDFQPQASYSLDIQEAIDYIKNNIQENINLDTLSEYIGLSKSGFLNKFKSEVGLTPHAYIITQRIALSKKLLKDPHISITDIAYNLNFSSGNHFSSIFKKYTGLSPSEYQTKYLSN